MAVKATVSHDDAIQNAAAVRALWSIGQESLRSCSPDDFQYGSTSDDLKAEIDRLKTKHDGNIPMGMNIDTVPKVRRIAEQYQSHEIDMIAALIIRHNSRFSATHFVRFLAVDDLIDRKKLLRQAIKESWSSKTITRQIQVCAGHRRPGVGRKPAVPSDLKACLMALDRQAESWLKWTKIARERRLPQDVKDKLDKVDRAMRALRQLLKPPAETNTSKR